MATLFKDSLTVVNVGIAAFADNVRAAGGTAVSLAWQPPAHGDRDAAWALAEMSADPRVEAANEIAFARFLEAQPVLVDIATARDALPAMEGGARVIAHAGPPIAWSAMCGPMQGAVAGAGERELLAIAMLSADSIFVHAQGIWVFRGQPGRRRGCRRAQHDADVVFFRQGNGAVQPLKPELAFQWFHGAPGEFADAYQVDMRGLHPGEVGIPL